MTEDNENRWDEAWKENAFKTCLSTTCHDTDESVGFLPSLHGQSVSASSRKGLQMVKKRERTKPRVGYWQALAQRWSHHHALWVPGHNVLVFITLPSYIFITTLGIKDISKSSSPGTGDIS